MKKRLLGFVLFVLGCSVPPKNDYIEVNFSPNGGLAESVVKEINISSKSIEVQAFSFTNKEIGQALLDAKNRGVVVEIILDKENLKNPNSLMHMLLKHNVTMFIDGKHAIAHNKIMIIDSNIVITGSANFTKAADIHNAENSLIIRDSNLALRYIVNWQDHKIHSEGPLTNN